MAKEVELLGKDSTGTFRTVLTTTDGTIQVTGSASTTSGSTVITGSTPSDTADSGDNPIKIGGIARQTNPTAVADGDRVSASFDDVGRQLVWPYQVRDLITTGYSVLTRSQEATILSAVAGAYQDVMSITATNTSSVAVPIAIRSVLAGNTELTIVAPAGGTVTRDFVVPRIQSDTGNAWTAQNATADQSDSTVSVSMTAIKNI